MATYYISSVADATPAAEAPSGYDLGDDANDGLSPIDLGGGVGPKLTASFAEALSAQDGHTYYVNGTVDTAQAFRLRGSVDWLPSGNSTISKIESTVPQALGLFSYQGTTSLYNGKVHNIGAIELSENNCTNGSMYMAFNNQAATISLNFNGTKFVDCQNRPWRGSASGPCGGNITATNISFSGSATSMIGVIEGVNITNGGTIDIDGIDFDITLSGSFNNAQGGINVRAADAGCAFILKNMTGSIAYAEAGTDTIRGISAREFDTYNVEDISYTLTDTADSGGFADGMFLSSTTLSSTQCRVRNFNASVNCSNGHHYLIGLDGGTATMSGIDIDGTDTTGPVTFTSGTMHGPTIGGTQGGTVNNVKSAYANLGLLTKENDGLLTVSNCDVSKAVSRGYYDKGSSVAPIYNNNQITLSTGYTCGVSGTTAALNAGSTDNNDPSLGAQFNNNLVLIEAGTTGTINLATVEGDVGSGASTATFQENNYWLVDGVIPDTFRYQSATALGLEDWNLLPQVSNDQSYDPFSNGSPTLTTPYSIGTNNGPLFTIKTSDTLATIEGAGFFNDNAGYASLLKTGDVVLIEASNGTKLYNVTVDKTSRIITLSTGTEIA